MIKIIAVGKMTQKHLQTGIDHYLKQIKNKIEIIEVMDEKNESLILKEEERILNNIKDNDYVIALAILGEMFDSVKFSDFLNQRMIYGNNNLVFVIGGSYGLSENVLKRADKQISFSKMTFPHQLMRLILVEQIYRGLMIIANHPYHK